MKGSKLETLVPTPKVDCTRPPLSGAGAAAPGACAAGPAAGAGTACRATGCAGDYAGIYASRESACLGAQNIHLRDGQVIARDDQIEVVLESEIDCVAQRKIELAVADE